MCWSHGFHNGVVTYNKPPENMATKHYRLFGTHREVGPGLGPFKHGFWMEWGELFANWVAKTDTTLAARWPGRPSRSGRLSAVL